MKRYKAYSHKLKLSVVKEEFVQKAKITSSQDVFSFLLDIFPKDEIELRENFYVVFLNMMNNTIGYERLSYGGISGTVVDPKMLFAFALSCNASKIILCHNHPSGNLEPSNSDKNITIVN